MTKLNVKRKSFYISLGVCIMAISAAGWSTYKSIKDFSQTNSRDNSQIISTRRKRSAEEIPKKKTNNTRKNLPEINPVALQEETLKEVSAKVSPPEFIVPIKYLKCTNYNDDLEYSSEFGDWRTSDGIELTGNPNVPVSSIADGKVVEIFEDPTYGTTVKLCHETSDNSELMAYYSRLDPNSISIKKGDKLKQGQEFAKLQNTNMHFMVQVNDKFLNPIKILGIE